MASDSEGMAAQMNLTNSRLKTANGHAIRGPQAQPAPHLPRPRRRPRVHRHHSRAELLVRARDAATVAGVRHRRSRACSCCAARPPANAARCTPRTGTARALRFAYDGADGVLRDAAGGFLAAADRGTRGPASRASRISRWNFAPSASQDLIVTCRVDERPVGQTPPASARAPRSVAAMQQAKEAASRALLDGYVRVETPSQALGEVLARSLSDVALLEVRRGEHRFTTAGIAVVRRAVRPRQPATDHHVPRLQPGAGRAHHQGAGALARREGRRQDARATRQDPARAAGR